MTPLELFLNQDNKYSVSLNTTLQNLKSKLNEMKRQVYTPVEIAAFKKERLAEINQEYWQGIESEKIRLQEIDGKFRDAYNERFESDNVEQQSRFKKTEYHLKAMDNKELENELIKVVRGGEPIPAGTLDILSCELKSRKMNNEFASLRKKIAEKKLDEPWRHIPEARPIYEKLNHFENLDGKNISIEVNGQFMQSDFNEIVDDILKE